MNGVMRMVMMRVRRSSIVRQAITAGTVQPKPISIGMNERPWRPKVCMIRSMRKAALAM